MSAYSEELANAQKSIPITAVPLVMDKPGEKFRGMYLGLKNWRKENPETGEISDQPIAHFYDGEKVLFQMGAQLTRAISSLKPGVSVEIVLSELKKNKHNGSTKIFSITPLKIPVANLEELFGGFFEIAAPELEQLPAGDPVPEPNLETSTNGEVDAWLASKDAEVEAQRKLNLKRTAVQA